MNTIKTNLFSSAPMPKIIYGTAWKKDKTAQLVMDAIAAGFRGIDTACQPKHYQENLVGEAIAKMIQEGHVQRSELFIQTKFTSLDGQDLNNIPYDKNAELTEQVRQSIEKSLSNLNVSYIDSLLMHSPMRTIKDTLIVWSIFEEYYKSGKIKQLGISNIYSLSALKQIWESVEVKPKVIQNRFYAQSQYDQGIRQFCNEHAMTYQSFWTLTANPHVVASKAISTISKRIGCSPEQCFFKFIMQEGIVPLTGTTSKKHMKEDIDVLKLSELNQDEMDLIRNLLY